MTKLEQKTSKAIAIMAGGTGGHVFPALAVARQLIEKGHEVLWIGTEKGLEARVVPAEGIELAVLPVTGLRGKGLLQLLKAPVMLMAALVKSLQLFSKRQPDVVLGMGGYVTGPGGVAAWLLRKPLVLHEQNAIPGTTNRILSRFATRVLEAFPDSFPSEKRSNVRWVGNPVRVEFCQQALPAQRYAQQNGAMRLLVVGGSLGAKALNEIVPKAIAEIAQNERPIVRHQCGERTRDVAEQSYVQAGVEASVETFIEDMASAYAWADLVICRAGAMTVSEIAAVGVAAIFVPFPYAIDDHQTHNAMNLVNRDAARIIPEAELSPSRLAKEIVELMNNKEELSVMASRAKDFAKLDATDVVVNELLEAA